MRSVHWPSIVAVVVALVGVGYAVVTGSELARVIAIGLLGVVIAILASGDKTR